MPRAWRLPNPTQLCESIVTDFFSSVAASSAEVPFTLQIPDTVVFKYGRPIARYRSTNSAVQRTADLESASEILASMVRGQRVRPPSRRPPPHGPVVAYYVEEPGRQSQHGGREHRPAERRRHRHGRRERAQPVAEAVAREDDDVLGARRAQHRERRLPAVEKLRGGPDERRRVGRRAELAQHADDGEEEDEREEIEFDPPAPPARRAARPVLGAPAGQVGRPRAHASRPTWLDARRVFEGAEEASHAHGPSQRRARRETSAAPGIACIDPI